MANQIVGEDSSRLPRLTLYTSDQGHSAVVRAAWIAGVPRGQVQQRQTQSYAISAPRGKIYDRNGNLLAVSNRTSRAVASMNRLADLDAVLEQEAARGHF